MNDTIFPFVVFGIVFAAVLYWMSKRGEGKRTVLTGPSADHADQIEKQREFFSVQTVKELQKYIQMQRIKLGIPAGRTPTRKAELIEMALALWQRQPW